MKSLAFRLLLTGCIIGGCVASSYADAATLRRATVLHHPQVRLSDIFNGLDTDQDCDLGQAPAPGESIVISSAQLEAIAQQYGIDWSDISATAQTTLTRASHTISQDEIMPQIVAGLKDRGVSDSAAIDISSFSGPTISADQNVQPQLANIVYDATHGRFSAFFSINPDGAAIPFLADGTVSSQIEAVIASRDIAMGEIISASDVEMGQFNSRSLPSQAIRNPSAVIGRSARRAIPAHAFLTAEITSRISLVDKGAPVVLDLSSAGIHLTASGVALDTGGIGERIHVLNPVSKMIVIGEVIDKSHVSVMPGTTPTPANAREAHFSGDQTQQHI